MPRPKRKTAAQVPLRKLWNKSDAPLPFSPEEKAAPISEADLVRMFRTCVRKLVPGDWVAYDLYPIPGVRVDLKRPPVSDDDTLAIMAYRPVNGEEPLLFIPLTDTLKLSHLAEYRRHIEVIQEWFYGEFPPVHAVRRTRWQLCKLADSSGMGYRALTRYLNDEATEEIEHVVKRKQKFPERRIIPQNLMNRLAAFGYGEKSKTIIADAIAACSSGDQPFRSGYPFETERVKEYLDRWNMKQS